LCVASSIRAMPENEIPPAMRVDIYFGGFVMKNIFIRKIMVLSMIGFGALAIGLVYGIITSDKIFIGLSVAVMFVCLYRIYDLYDISKKKNYIELNGKCSDINYVLIGKYYKVTIDDVEGEKTVSVPKQCKLKIGNCYSLYFRKYKYSSTGNKYMDTKIEIGDYIGYELL